LIEIQTPLLTNQKNGKKTLLYAILGQNNISEPYTSQRKERKLITKDVE
jgi:hypothetical protein